MRNLVPRPAFALIASPRPALALILFVAALSAAAAACSAPDDGAGGAGGGHAAGSGGSDVASSSGTQSSASSGSAAGSASGGATTDGPQFLAFGTDVSMITAGEQVMFSATLADADGGGDIAGGTLVDQFGTAYGAFAKTAQEGGYQLSVSWPQIDEAEAILLPYGATVARTFTARFFDQEGHGTERSVMIRLTCNGLAACGGACVDTVQYPESCTTCSPACSDGAACFLGKCAALSACVGKMTSCQVACAAAGLTCANECDGGRGGIAYAHAGCAGESHPVLCGDSIFAYDAAECCCF